MSIMLAINIGDQFCKVAVASVPGQKALEEVDISFLHPVLPSLLALGEDCTIKIGTDAQALRGTPHHTGIGIFRHPSSLVIGAMDPTARHQSSDRQIASEVQAKHSPNIPHFSSVQLIATFLSSIVDVVSWVACCSVSKVVVTVPVWLTPAQRDDLVSALELIDLTQVGIINEVTASLIDYSLAHQTLLGFGDHHIVLVDIGHASSTVTVATLGNNKAEVKNTISDTTFGGNFIDLALLDYLEGTILGTKQATLFRDLKASGVLLVDCQRVKEVVCQSDDSSKAISFGVPFEQVSITGEGLDALIKPMHQTSNLVMKCLAMAGITSDQVHEVVLLGGSFGSLTIKNAVTGIFPWGTLIKFGLPTAIAGGAIYACGQLRDSGYHKFNDEALSDLITDQSSVSLWRELAIQHTTESNGRSLPKFDCSNLEEQYTLKKSTCLRENALPQTVPISQTIGHEPHQVLDNLTEKISALQQTIESMSNTNPEKPLHLNELTTLLLTRVARDPTIEDLTLALSAQTKAVSLASSIADKAKYLDSMATAMEKLFSIKPDITLLNNGILGLQMAEMLAAGDVKNRAKYLNNLSHMVHLRYQTSYNMEDLNLAIVTQRRALDLMSNSENAKSRFLQVFGLMLDSRFDKLGDIVDLKEALSSFENAMDIASPIDQQQPLYFFNFGVSLKKLFDQLGNMPDLDKSVLYQNMAVNIALDTNIQKPMFCCHLGKTLQARFLQKWNIEDLDNAIQNYQYAVKLVNDDYRGKSVYLNHLGEAFGMYYIHQGIVPYLDHAILFQRRALKLTPLRDQSLYLRNLAFLLETRFHSSTGNLIQDLEEAITSRQQAAVSMPLLPENQKNFSELVASLYFSYKISHNIKALATAISTQKELIQLTSESQNKDQEKHAQYMFDLGRLLQVKFDENGIVEDLEEAVVHLNKAIGSTKDNSLRAKYSSHLGAALCTRFVELNNMSDLKASIAHAKQAVELAANDDPDRLSYTNNFARAMVLHYQNFGDTESLDIAVKQYETIVTETSDTHPSKALRLSNLSVAQMALFGQEGSTPDLQKAVLTSQEAVKHAPVGDLNQFSYLSNLASALQAHWQHTGKDIEDLDQAISIQQRIVDDIPAGHSDKAGHLNNLGGALHMRYEALGEVFDLNNGLYYHSKAVEATPIGHSHRPIYLNSLGNSFKKRFTRKLISEDLETAISLYQEAIELTQNTHVNRGMYLYNLGRAFMASFDFTGNIQDLKMSILHQKASLQITLPGDPLKIPKLANLGDSLRQQANPLKDLSGLENALGFIQESLDLMPVNHPEKTQTLLLQCQALEEIFEINRDENLLQKSLKNYKQAVKLQSGSPSSCFVATLRWVSYARKYNRTCCIEAYTCALELLPQLAWLGLSIEAQFERLSAVHSLVSDAAATALGLGYIELALEWLENGRSVVWSQVLQLKQPLEHLHEINPILAGKIEELSKNLSHHRAHNASFFADKGLLQAASLYEKSIGIQHRLAKSWEDLQKEMQETPEFKDILGNRSSQILKEAASQGPVVILNASSLQCDAIIIVSPSLPLVHLPLHQTSYDKIHDLQQELLNLLVTTLGLRNGTEKNSTRYGGPARNYMTSADDVFRYILGELWNTVVEPVLDLLHFNSQSSTTKIPRIWWCPTSKFTFLPIHAAGIYGKSGTAPVTLADYAVSSYIPNLGVLLSSRRKFLKAKSSRVLAVAQADTPGQQPLPGVLRELVLMDKTVPLEVIDGPKATVQNVLTAMRNFSWVHFSCHGTQNMDIPTLSGLHLHDGVLSLRQIINESLPDAEFAFLSACQTASGDYAQPDETLHLAGGMMLAGFRSVIATMWSVSDQDAPVITGEVYEYLFQNNLKKPSGEDGAIALHLAIQKLRNQYQNKFFASWVPFIHMGI